MKAENDTSKKAAFFDLDGTLIGKNSASLWMSAERRAGRLGRRLALEGALYVLLYRFRRIDMHSLSRKALTTIRGLTEDELRERTYQWFRRDVLPHAAPGARPAIERHRRGGDRLVLLTSASVYESEAAVEAFALDDFLATRYEVANGRFTGEPLTPLCYGRGKVEIAERYAKEAGIDLDGSFFYTDSFTDSPMLARVGNPRAVNPDLRLKLEARLRGWPIEDWS
jgi:HAD superfamily hydrolase (TIGR01490 family)